MSTPQGRVYFLIMKALAEPDCDFGFVKIGITSGDVLHRVTKLQTGNPHDLFCFDSIETHWPREVELFMHRTHAADMQKLEWLRCTRNDLRSLVNEAREAARQIENRKSKEASYTSHPSNGQIRRASQEEFLIHNEARKLMKELVPAKLRLVTNENRLKASTGATFGIPGVIRVKYLPAGIRFCARRAQEQFPSLASQCSVEKIRGTFRWRKMPMAFHFASENQSALEQQAVADNAMTQVLQANLTLRGWAERTAEAEQWHSEFLHATRAVLRLEAELANLQTELTLRLGDCDALEPVCSFKRRVVSRVQRAAFCKDFPEEAERCARQVGPRLQKFVYPARAYL